MDKLLTKNKQLINKAINDLHNNKIFNDFSWRYGKENHEDLKSTVILQLLEMPEEKLLTMIEGNYVTQYGMQMLRFQVSNCNWSEFRKNYHNREKFTPLEIILGADISSNNDNDPINSYVLATVEPVLYGEELMDDEDLSIIIKKKMEQDTLSQSNEYFYQARILTEMLERKCTAKELSKLTGIPYRSVCNAVKSYRTHLKEWLKNELEK